MAAVCPITKSRPRMSIPEHPHEATPREGDTPHLSNLAHVLISRLWHWQSS